MARRPLLGALLALPAVLAVVLYAVPMARAADHRDGPRITGLNNVAAGALDLNDLYLFRSPANRNNTVIIQTFSPAAGIVGPGTFFPGAAHELRISNDGDPLTDEIVINTTFGAPNSAGQQQFMVQRTDGSGSPTFLAEGVTNSRFQRLRGGGVVTAGIFDDPFFFDAGATARFNREATFLGLARQGIVSLPPDIPPNTDPTRHFRRPFVPNNFFGGFNTLAIVIEVPRARLQSSRSNPNVTMWCRTVADIGDGRGFSQFDRTAFPGINTLVVPLTRTSAGETLPNGLQDQFNFLTPADDIGLRPVAVDRLINIFGLTPAAADGIANTFLPDVMPFNTTATASFPNGRQLKDDVIDLALTLLTNSSVTTDRVVNDSYFRRKFPYMGPPNPITGEL